jgi:hypothetical protein
MTYAHLMSGYFTCALGFAIGSFGWLMFRHRKHINAKAVLEAIADPKKRKLPPELQSKWEQDSKFVGRISMAILAGWVFLMFFGQTFTK